MGSEEQLSEHTPTPSEKSNDLAEKTKPKSFSKSIHQKKSPTRRSPENRNTKVTRQTTQKPETKRKSESPTEKRAKAAKPQPPKKVAQKKPVAPPTRQQPTRQPTV